jgi:Bacterial alpha-L-rhamnosidase 6 hairpin glycosidase domain
LEYAANPEPDTRQVHASALPRRAFVGVCLAGLAARWAFRCGREPAMPGSMKEARLADLTLAQKVDSRVELDASDASLVNGFQWAKSQALSYVFEGDPVGPWYEAALPGRHAFCMRDTAHQSAGAQILGLAAFNENMLRRFAENISASRDWCSYWEINKNNVPAAVDYVNDRDFWYNLPANFDVLDACHRQFLWTGNRVYLDPVFMNFYSRTVTDYVKKWDMNGDGLLEHLPQYGHRGIASYDEQHIPQMMVGADLVAAQYAAYRDYARIALLVADKLQAEEFQAKAEHLKSLYSAQWWSGSRDSYYGAIGNDGKLQAIDNVLFSLYCQIVEAGHKTERALATLMQQLPADNNNVGGVEERSYVPEILYRYGRSDVAYHALLSLMDPTLKRREYPEVSFALIGACAIGLMGITPDSPSNTVATFPQLSRVQSAELKHVPVFSNEISIRHVAGRSTVFRNESGPPIQWRASLPGRFAKLTLDGKKVVATTGDRLGGAAETWIIAEVDARQTRVVEVPL